MARSTRNKHGLTCLEYMVRIVNQTARIAMKSCQDDVKPFSVSTDLPNFATQNFREPSYKCIKHGEETEMEIIYEDQPCNDFNSLFLLSQGWWQTMLCLFYYGNIHHVCNCILFNELNRTRWWHVQSVFIIRGFVYQTQVARVWIYNYIPQILQDVMICPRPWYRGCQKHVSGTVRYNYLALPLTPASSTRYIAYNVATAR